MREVQQRGGFTRLMPGNFYRTLRTMLADGLIADVREPDGRGQPSAVTFASRRSARAVAAAEARRLEAAVLETPFQAPAGKATRMIVPPSISE